MKIPKQLSPADRPLRSLFKTFARLAKNTFFTLLGFLMALLTLNALEGEKGRPQPTSSAKDTMYVQIVNAGAFPASNMPAKPLGDTTTNIRTDSVIENRDLPEIPTNSIKPPVTWIPVSPGMVTEARESFTRTIKQFPVWATVIIIAVFLLALLYFLYYELPPLFLQMRTISDPEKLKVGFNAFKSDIESIGNPRKIKRLSNKLRFQYHYLEGKGLCERHHVNAMFQLLIFFEQTSSTLMDVQTKKQIASNLGNFTNFFTEKYPSISFDPKFMQVMFALNKRSFYYN